MSECDFEYKFFFSTPSAGIAAVQKARDFEDAESKASAFGFAQYIDEDSEYLDSVLVTETFFCLSFTTSSYASINHRLIRASKDIGCEFCIVNVFNNQVGEGGRIFLFRGREVGFDQRRELLAKYEPHRELTEAISKGDQAFVKQSIQAGLDIDKKIDGLSLLELAVNSDQLDIFKLLLKANPNVNVPVGNEPNLLMHLVKNLGADFTDYVTLLLKAGANFNARDKDGASALWYLWSINRPLQKILFKRGAAIASPKNTYTSDNGLENLSIALHYGDHHNIVKYFKTSAKNKDNWKDIAHHCVSNDYFAPVEVLLKNGFLQEKDAGDYLKALLECSLEGTGLESFTALFELAESRRVDLSASAEEFLHKLLERKNASKIIENLARSYPSVLTPRTFGCAIKSKHKEYLTLLFVNSFPLKEYEELEGRPAIHSLIFNLDLPTLELLHRSGMDLNKGYQGENIIEYCITDDDLDKSIKQYLLTHVTGVSEEILAFAYVHLNDLDAFKSFWKKIKNRSVVNDEGNSLLMAACSNPESTIVQFLLSQNVDVTIRNFDDKTAFAIAYESGAAKAVELLVASGVDPDEIYPVDDYTDNGEMATRLLNTLDLTDAIENPIVSAVENSKKLKEDSTYLMHAAISGNLKMLRLLVENGADIWRKDSSNQDALIYAIVAERNSCVDYLLNLDKTKDAIKEQGAALINMASTAGNDHAIKSLLKMGVTVDSGLEDESITPLMLATILSGYHGHQRGLNALIQGGANLGKVDDEGKTPLIYACTAGYQDTIATLLAAGGHPDHIDKNVKTAFDYFVEHNMPATKFNLEDLKPKNKLTGVYKVLVASRSVILKWIIPSYILLSIAARFIQTYAVYAMVLVLLASVVKVALLLRAPKTDKIIETNDEDEIDSTIAKKSNFLAAGLAAMEKAMNANIEKQLENQAIIDSWDDDNRMKEA